MLNLELHQPEVSGEALRDQHGDSRQIKEASVIADRRTGPKEPGLTVLSLEDEAVILVFRRYIAAPRRLPLRAHQ